MTLFACHRLLSDVSLNLELLWSASELTICLHFVCTFCSGGSRVVVGGLNKSVEWMVKKYGSRARNSPLKSDSHLQ